MRLRSVALLTTLAALALAVFTSSPVAGAKDAQRGSGTETQVAQASPSPLPFVLNPDPLFKPTGGPFIGEAKAVEIAMRVALSSKGSQQRPPHAVQFLPYSAVVAWAGSRTMTIHLDRELYLVVIKAPFLAEHGMKGPTTCQSQAVTIDATDGTIRGRSCFLESWPLRLPPQFSGIVM